MSAGKRIIKPAPRTRPGPDHRATWGDYNHLYLTNILQLREPF